VTQIRVLSTPRIETRAVASRRTARGLHGFTLADLINDATSGHPAQRGTVLYQGGITGGVFHILYQPTGVARFLALRWTVMDTLPLSMEVSITDGTNTIPSTDARIPEGLDDDAAFYSSLGSNAGSPLTQWEGASYWERYLDINALTTGSPALSTSLPWRITVDVTNGTMDGMALEELPRWLVDNTDAQGVEGQSFQPRAVIQDGTAGVTRWWQTLRQAYTKGLRTYQHLALEEGLAAATSATAYAAIPGVQEESTGVPRPWTVRPRTMRGTAVGSCPIKWGVFYRTLTGFGADVKLTTGEGTYTIALAATSGVWTLDVSGTGFLSTATGTDTMEWYAQVADASEVLEIATFWVVDDP
jgi:hypothetical protein